MIVMKWRPLSGLAAVRGSSILLIYSKDLSPKTWTVWVFFCICGFFGEEPVPSKLWPAWMLKQKQSDYGEKFPQRARSRQQKAKMMFTSAHPCITPVCVSQPPAVFCRHHWWMHLFSVTTPNFASPSDFHQSTDPEKQLHNSVLLLDWIESH